MVFFPIAATAMMLNSMLVVGVANFLSKQDGSGQVPSSEHECADDIQGI